MDRISGISYEPVSGSDKKAAGSTSGNSQSSAFSEIYESALQDSMTSAALTMSPDAFSMQGMTSGVMQTGSAIEALMSAAVSGGSISDAETAMFMLCMMMQSESASKSPELTSMLTMLAGLAGQSGGSVSPAAVYSTSGSQGNKSANQPEVSATGGAVVPSDAWKPVTPAIVGSESNRSPQRLQDIIDQFDVENSERYRPYRRGSDTYCNIFLWDVTYALGCEIPHFVDPSNGNPRKYPDIEGAVELDAVGVENWLVNYGGQYGWREVDAKTAQDFANAGKPAVTTAGTIGHVQVVCPSRTGGYDPVLGVTVAQSGSRNINYTHITNIFSQGSMSKIRYFVHD